MTRKDYVVISEALNRARPGNTILFSEDKMFGWQATVNAIADALAADNPRFDRSRFMAAAKLI